MNYVLGGRTIGAVLGRSAGAAVSWWLAAGVTPIAAYAPKGAASLAASYTNLANPGTYNAAPGVAPTWSTATGWTFNNSHYLTTGITPASGWTAIVRVASVVSAHNGSAFGANGNSNSRFSIIPSTSGSQVSYASGSFNTVSPELLSGVLGVAGQQGYRNGSAEGGTITAWSADASYPIFIGARNSLGTAILLFRGAISSLWIANTTLSAANVALQSAAMP